MCGIISELHEDRVGREGTIRVGSGLIASISLALSPTVVRGLRTNCPEKPVRIATFRQNMEHKS